MVVSLIAAARSAERPAAANQLWTDCFERRRDQAPTVTPPRVYEIAFEPPEMRSCRPLWYNAGLRCTFSDAAALFVPFLAARTW